MFKWVVLIKKKQGMSRQEFIDYYENIHVPLLTSILPSMKVYRRNYLTFDDPLFAVDNRAGSGNDAGFDVVTEAIFNSREEAKALMDTFAIPEVMVRVQADEANFVEPGGAKQYIVEVHESSIP